MSEIFLESALKILGWQGGTIHQVLDVLSAAKFLIDTHQEAEYTGEYDKIGKAIAALQYCIKGG